MPFHRLLIFWSPGNVHVSFQLVRAVVPLVSTTCPWKPPDQLLVTEYAAEHDPVGGGDVGGGDVGGGDVGGGEPFTAPGSGNSSLASSDCLAELTGVAS